MSKTFFRCFICKKQSFLFRSHTYNYLLSKENNIRWWATVYYDLCNHCKSFTKLDTRYIDIHKYIREHEITQQKSLNLYMMKEKGN